jgi:DNA-binding MarR family transcriptional regulator
MSDVKPGEDPVTVGEAPSSVGFLLSQLGFVLARRFQQVMVPLGLEPRQFLLMRLVTFNEGKTQQALGEALNIPASRMVAIVDELEQRGLLERRPDPADRRVRRLYVTAEGRRLLDRALEAAMAHEQRVSAPLSPGERAQLLDLLHRLADDQEITAGVHPDLTTPDSAGC